MLARYPLIAFVATANPERTREFYAGVLGLRLVADDPFALVFEAGGMMLRIQKVETVVHVPYTALGWQVPDIEATMRVLVAAGVTPERYSVLEQNDLGVWTTPDGSRVAWFRDPDGNLLSLTQFDRA